MKGLLRTIFVVGSSRAVPPVVIGVFFIVYIGIAFFTDEALITLIAFTSRSKLLAALLFLIPMNYALRIIQEIIRNIKIRSVLNGKMADGCTELFEEIVELRRAPVFPDLEKRLAAAGYKTCRLENYLTAWRGIRIFPARIFFYVGAFCLFTGILISITTRTADRRMVIEGEPLPTPQGVGGSVERITLSNSLGPILTRTLTMEVAPSSSGYGRKTFGIYPPSLYDGAFVYPRFLGLALHLRFTAPDLPSGYENQCILNIYPPGKEHSEGIPDSPYRIVFSVPDPGGERDRFISYMEANPTLLFKLLKGKDLLFTGSAPAGGQFERDGYRLSFPDIKRLVVTDFIGDRGVFFIWVAALFFIAASALWLPIRCFFPRREMMFRFEQGVATACSSAEGGARKHAGVFSELLDMIDAGKPGNESFRNGLMEDT